MKLLDSQPHVKFDSVNLFDESTVQRIKSIDRTVNYVMYIELVGEIITPVIESMQASQHGGDDDGDDYDGDDDDGDDDDGDDDDGDDD